MLTVYVTPRGHRIEGEFRGSVDVVVYDNATEADIRSALETEIGRKGISEVLLSGKIRIYPDYFVPTFARFCRDLVSGRHGD